MVMIYIYALPMEIDAKIFRVTIYNIHIFAALPLCHISKFNPGELHHEIDEETW